VAHVMLLECFLNKGIALYVHSTVYSKTLYNYYLIQIICGRKLIVADLLKRFQLFVVVVVAD